MILVIQTANKYNIDPDNVATPIAASLGDLATLAIMSVVAATMVQYPLVSLAVLLVLFCGIGPYCQSATGRCPDAKLALANGWTPVLTAMAVSSLGGKILNSAIVSFPDISSLQVQQPARLRPTCIIVSVASLYSLLLMGLLATSWPFKPAEYPPNFTQKLKPRRIYLCSCGQW